MAARGASGRSFNWEDRKVVTEVSRRVGVGMRAVGKHLAAEFKSTLSGPAGSPAGGPPGRVDGDLVAAVGYKVRRRSGSVSLVAGVTKDPAQLAKGARLAGGFVGTDRDGRTYSQEPRPFLPELIERNKPDIKRLLVAGAGIDTGSDEG